MAKKTRILFVDDEPMILQGLQRMLRTMREEWEMEFADGGDAALAKMAQAPFDVVVSDMRMPGMNGAQLLNEVMRLYPRTIRLVLSGHSDRELTLRCVGSTHQFLAKPCDAASLKATIRRATALEASLQSEAVRVLVAQLSRVPSVPALYSRIVELLQDPETGIDDIGNLIASDIGMTANILKLVNSAFFGLPREVSNAAEAVSFLGIDTVKSLVLSIHAFAQFEHAMIGGLSVEALWTHSLKVASGAKALAREMGAGSKLTDEVFVAGMLHDVGKLVLCANFSARYQDALYRMRSRGVSAAEAERECFDTDHGEVGGYLLGLWGLPVPVVEAIALHHAPGRSAAREFSPLAAVHLADALCREPGPSAGPTPMPDESYLRECGLDRPLPEWRDLIVKQAA